MYTISPPVTEPGFAPHPLLETVQALLLDCCQQCGYEYPGLGWIVGDCVRITNELNLTLANYEVPDKPYLLLRLGLEPILSLPFFDLGGAGAEPRAIAAMVIQWQQGKVFGWRDKQQMQKTVSMPHWFD